MLRPIDRYFLQLDEPEKGCLQFLREFILSSNEHFSEAWKYGMPFFCYKGKMCVYLWMHKKYHQPYIGFVHGNAMTDPELLVEKRAKMKILLLKDRADLPSKKIAALLKKAIKAMP